MKIQAHKLTISKTAHYYSLGQPGKHIRELWIVCHGYGQLASDIITELSILDNGKRYIVAPEGLSRFYWGGFVGPVAASWMTSKDRLDEIADYSNYLTQLLNLIRSELPKPVKVILLGFSQGTATQCRWIIQHHPSFDQLILWAGLIPEDIDYQPHLSYLKDKPIYFVYGKQDRFLTAERLQAHQGLINEQKLAVQQIAFDGKHKIDPEVLDNLANNWNP